jgi:MFS family permease
MHLFKNRPFIGTILTAAIGSCVYYSLAILWPIQIAVLYETNIIMIGWWSCIIGAGSVIGQSLCGIFVKRIGKQKWQLVAAITGLTAFIAGMAGATASTKSLALAFTIIGSICLGYVENVAFTIAPFCIPAKDIGLALGLLGCVRASIASVATAVFVSVLENKLAINIPKYVIPAATTAGLPAASAPGLLAGLAIGNFTGVEGVTPQIIAAAAAANQVAYTESFKVVYLAALAFGIVGILSALNSQNSEKFFTEDISRKLHGKDLDKMAAKHEHDHEKEHA